GLLNPHTEVSGELTIESVLEDPMVSTPLTRSMLALISTGGSQGFVVSKTPVDARSVEVRGYGEACAFMSLSQAPSLVHFEHIRRAADLALRQADVELADIDFVQFYDPATIVPLILLESIGFCGEGEGGSFVENGAVEIGGRLPMNTHGGT